MRVVAAEVEDFGVFSGVHRFQLVDGEAAADHPPRALIVGHNGSGKSTLFRAISLALYGPVAIGNRLSRQAYQEQLRGLVHHGPGGAASASTTSARVSVDLEYVRLGISETLRLQRSWQCSDRAVTETASAYRLAADGSIMEAVEEQAVAELLPPDLRKMMLVDVALVDELTLALQSPGALERILRELSGLRLIERLRDDLLTVDAQAKRDTPAGRDAESLQRWTTRVREIDAALEVKRAQVEQASVRVADIDHEIAEQERELMTVGGGLAESRPALRERLLATESELEQSISELRDLCNGTLPFALCPTVCLELDAQLHEEALAAGAESLLAFADEWIDELCDELVADKDLRELVPRTEQRLAISEHLRRTANRSLESRVQPSKHMPVHDLSERDRAALRAWIADAVGLVPSRVAALSLVLDRLEDAREHTRMELDRVPDESGLKAVQRRLQGLRERLIKASSEELRGQDLLDALEAERRNVMSQIREVEEMLAETAAGDRAAELVHRTRLALADFEQDQLQQRAAEFADALVSIFNGLSRKQSLLAGATFDSASGAFSLVDGDGRQLDLSKLSTGELQLYSMALLESLRVTGGRDYPLLVDTPLAYLDEQHREALLSDLLFASRGQVVLFATDQEIDSNALERWAPDVDRVYRLRFNTDAQSSVAATEVSGSTSAELSGQVA